MTRYPLADVADALTRVVRPAMRRTWRPDSCIAASAIAVETLRATGHEAIALTVEARAFNKPLWGWAGRGDPDSKPPAGCHEVTLGLTESDVVGPGGLTSGKELHVVAWSAPLIIDLSLDQARRPKKGLPLKPLALAVPAERIPGFVAGEDVVAWTATTGWGITYRVRRGVTWWEMSPDWTYRRRAMRARVVGQVIRSLRDGA